MERLTNQEIAKELKQNVEATITTTQNVSRDIYLRFAEFEDFMEQEEFTSLEDLKAYIKLQSKGSNDLMQENQALKDRWQKLKEFIGEQSNPIDNLVVSDNETKYIYMSDILDEMQELEKE